jgi:hypothetical protein
MKKYYLLLLFGFFSQLLYGQGEAAVGSLTLQQSPFLNGAGQIGASIPTSDAIGFYYNPAQLGYFSRENNLSLYFMPQNTKWLNNYSASGITFRSVGMTAGYNFNKNGNSLPLSIGIGYIHNKFDYGEYYYPQGNTHNYDSFNCFSIGASYDCYLLFNIGLSIKSFYSKIGYNPTELYIISSEVSSTAFDFGTMITAPISKLFFNNFRFDLSKESFLKPRFDWTVGYSITNIGKEIYYVDPAQSDPIPRTARLGYTFDFGMDLILNEKKLNVIDYSFTAEAEDILIKRNQYNGTFEYQRHFGDIIFGKHLIELRGDENVVVHRGHVFKLFETYTFLTGRFHGRSNYNRKTNGYGLSSEGIFKLLGVAIDNKVIHFIADHFVVEYYDTNIFVDSGMDTNFKGFSFYLKKLEL